MKLFYIILYSLIITYSFDVHSKSAVTYTFSGGRFGDCLISYCHAKWIEYKYKMRFFYIPFKYSDQLMMHQLETHYTQDLGAQFKRVATYNDVKGYLDADSDFLYVIPFFCESIFERNDPYFPFLFMVDWKDKEFKNELKRMICPITPFPEIDLPTDCISVAVHVRKGTGWDIPQFAPSFEKLTEMHPLRWPPDDFYIEQIKKIADMFPDQKLYVYIFTDHDNPREIMHKFEQLVNNSRLIFDCRTQENKHNLHVLEDFFALTKFDCLIRSDSNFSLMASKIGEYKVQISPWHSVLKDGAIVINEICIEINKGRR